MGRQNRPATEPLYPVALRQRPSRAAASLLPAAHNSGSPFGQWRRAVRQATGELVWLAEADDGAEPDFLARLAPHFRDQAVVMAFTDSAPIDEAGAPAPVDYRTAYAATGWGPALAADATHDAPDFAASCLANHNILFNVSAILWRRDALEAALARIPDLETWHVAGDWRVAWDVLTHGGRIAHIAAALNRHRRAPTTASARVPPDAHLAEIRRMHTIIRARLGDANTLLEGQNRVVADATDFLRRK